MQGLDKVILAAGHPHFFHRASVWVAQKQGFFAEEGIDNYEILATGTDEKTLEGVIKGSIHVGLDIRPAIVLRENNKGADVYVIGAFINGFPFTLIGDKTIKSAGDLKGKRIEVVGSGGGIDERQIRAYLRKNNLDPERDVQWERDAPFPNIAKVMERIEKGEIQARAVWTEDAPLAQRQGYTMLCDFFAEYYPEGYLQRAIVTSGKMINEHPDILKAVLKVIIRGYRFLRKEENYGEKNKIVDISTTEEGLGWEEMDYSKIERQYLGYKILPRDGNITKVGFQQMIEEEKSEGKLPESYRMDQVVRLDLVEMAARELDAKYGPEGYA